MRSLLGAEYLKLRTTRTLWALLGAVVIITTLAVSAAVVGLSPAEIDLASDKGVRAVLHVAGSGAIFVLLLGIVITAGEYRQRTAVDTFLTTPRRARVLVAKLGASISTGVAFGALGAIVAITVAAVAYQFKGVTFPLGNSLAWKLMAGSIVYAALFGGLGASIGALVRNQVAAMIGAIGVIIIAASMIMELSPAVGRWLPAALGMAVVSDPGGDFFSQRVAGLLLLSYVIVIMAAAAWVESRRDA